MGWFDGWFGGSEPSKDSDPLRRLDPKLREFLEKESPIKYNNPQQQTPPPPPQSQPTPQNQTPSQQQQQQPPTDGTPQPSAVPNESLYQDGRYAHLWKTYRPLAAIEADTKSDNEKLSDVLEAFKERKAQIGRAALENCAEEQFSWNHCMRSGSWDARMTLCREEVRAFERCYSVQGRLLKALGYLSVQGRGADVDEEIQMRADELFHRMLAQEREMKKAKEEGREVPKVQPLFERKMVAGEAAGPEPSPALVATWKDRLEKLPPEEREAEEQALRAEFKAKAEMAAQVQNLWKEQAKEREARKAEGKETMMDKFNSLVGAWSGPRS